MHDMLFILREVPPLNGIPPKVSMPVVNQITRSPGLLNFNRFSPHTFHLDKKIEVFAAEGSLNHESPGQLKFRRFSARNHQFTLENQAYTTPHHIPWITLRLKCIHIPTVLLGKETKCACAFTCTQCLSEQFLAPAFAFALHVTRYVLRAPL